MKIKVCCPFYSEFETAKPGFRSLQSDPRFELSFSQGSLIAVARNALINDRKSKAIYQDPLPYDFFLFVDSDIGFDISNVERLLSYNLDIVSSPYRCHADPGVYQAGMFSQPGIISGKCTTDTKGLHQVDYCGAGFLLVKASCFSKMRFPWFRHSIVEVGGMASETGEDVGFCMNARQAGFDIWCDFDNPVFHKPRTLESFDFTL